MNTLIYARVSTEDQAERYGLPAQMRACREYAATHALPPVSDEITDDLTGKNTDRPGLDKLRRLVAAGGISHVVILEPDRLGRDLLDLLTLKREIERSARLEFVSGRFEDSPSGRLFFGMKGAFAEYEREVIRERTMRGQKERARGGLLVGGRIPFGYGCAEGRLVPDAHAQIVRDIFRWYDSGSSLRAIAGRLRADGVPTWGGKPWGFTSVRFILANETYAGVAHFGGVAVSVPALVDRPTWERARARLTTNTGGRPTSRYLLRGLLYCACGRKMHGERARRGRDQYRCSGRDPMHNYGQRCTRSIAVESIDQMAWELVTGILTDVDAVRAQIEAREAELRDSGTDERIARLQAAIARLKGREAAAVSSMLDPDLPRDVFKAAYRSAMQERQALEAELGSLQTQAEQARGAVAWMDDALAVWRDAFESLDTPEEKQEAMRRLVTRAEWDGTELSLSCFFGGKLFITPRHSEQFPGVQVVVKTRVAA